MEEELVLTERELMEIGFAMKYSKDFNHGTDGHNRLNVLTKLALALGFRPSENTAWGIAAPQQVRIDNYEGRNITWPT